MWLRIISYSLLKACVITAIFAFLIGGTVYYQVVDTNIDPEKLKIEIKPTVIYDKNGQQMAGFYQDIKYNTKYEDIPIEIIQALVSTEDKDFYQHPGLSIKGIIRAWYSNFKTNTKSQGGSTITQQLVKTIYLSNKKTYDRKKEEVIYATSLEKMYSKNEIITDYLNHVTFGYGSFGVQDAVLTYFGESLSDLKKESRVDRLVKSALIAGLPQSPSRLSPYTNPKITKERRNHVLSSMLQSGYITNDEYQQAILKPFQVLKNPNVVHDDEKIKQKEMVFYVMNEAAQLLNVPVDQVKSEGVNIYTSFDPEVYQTIRDYFKIDKYFPKDAKDKTKVQGAAVILNPVNGEIYAMTGQRQANVNFMDFNRSFQMYRQPGSTFKPIAVYGPAIESGEFGPFSQLLDEQGHDFGGGYVVKDWDGGGRGRVTMVEAAKQSWNIAAVWTLQQIGIPTSKAFLKKLGIDLTKDKSSLSMGLGGIEKGVSPLQMADAYQAYANGGYRTPAHAIRQIVDHQGKVIYEVKDAKKQVISEKTAEILRYMLREGVRSGTGARANVEGQMISGKTGTTEYPGIDGANKDIWFSGFTKDYVGIIWMGFDNTDQKHYLNSSESSKYPAIMFGDMFQPLLKKRPDPEENYGNIYSYEPKTESFTIDGRIEADNKAVITWNAEDGVKYKVTKNGMEISGEFQNSYEDISLEVGKSYKYQVYAIDADTGFKSLQSNTVTLEIKLVIPSPSPSAPVITPTTDVVPTESP
jgi:penicillin-binding protein 2A